MKNKVAILGSTGSIGITTLKIIKKNKKNFELKLLSTNNNAEKIFNRNSKVFLKGSNSINLRKLSNHLIS